MSHDNYDDGLIHGHDWARDRPAHIRAAEAATGAVPGDEDRFDDGLVHGHGWACGERGRMAHRA